MDIHNSNSRPQRTKQDHKNHTVQNYIYRYRTIQDCTGPLEFIQDYTRSTQTDLYMRKKDQARLYRAKQGVTRLQSKVFSLEKLWN